MCWRPPRRVCVVLVAFVLLGRLSPCYMEGRRLSTLKFASYSGSRSNVTMPNQKAMPTWKVPHSGKPKIEPNEINDLLYANVGHSLLAWSPNWCRMGVILACFWSPLWTMASYMMRNSRSRTGLFLGICQYLGVSWGSWQPDPVLQLSSLVSLNSALQRVGHLPMG